MIADQELEELRQFAEIGRVSASLIHEIGNPLTAAILHLELSDQDSLAVHRARQAMKLLHRYVKAARLQLRRPSQPCHFYAQPQINQLKPVLIPLARQAGVYLALQPAPRYQLYGDPVKFQQIIANLVTNAIESYHGLTSPGRTFQVKLSWQYYQGFLVMTVSDHGGGIEPTILPLLFKEFVSTKSAGGRGLGLGLATIKQYVVEDFGGIIYAESSKQKGTTFTVELPAVAI